MGVFQSLSNPLMNRKVQCCLPIKKRFMGDLGGCDEINLKFTPVVLFVLYNDVVFLGPLS